MLMSCVSSSAKITPVSGERIVPPRIAPMLTSGQKPTPSAGRNQRFDAAERAAHHQQRREHAARVPEPSDTAQMTDLTSRTPRITRAGDVALQQVADDVVADAERLRKDQAADADHEAADRRPPHPVDRQLAERRLRRRRRPASAAPTARRRAARRARSRASPAAR